jgi:nifR3 family TIM-barrel protein
MSVSPLQKFGHQPIVLAPLAGVSDNPFRRICQELGADLTYVEMLSATALVYGSQRTFEMAKRHADEPVLGVQLTGKTPEEVGQAVTILERYNFDCVDINMGCPVNKVVKSGCGSGILKDPERVYQTVRAARHATAKPLSAKIRLGWDHSSNTALEVCDAIIRGGADWLTVHGRYRSDDYDRPVDLEWIARIKQQIGIPVIGNGNIFSAEDAASMFAKTHVDGVMVSRGALGNPWIFEFIKGTRETVSLDEWYQVVKRHLQYQRVEYGNTGFGAVCMRKHLLWYVKGWPGARKVREEINGLATLEEAERVLDLAVNTWAREQTTRGITWPQEGGGRFVWDPKYDMDRSLDRGVGHEMLDISAPA